MSTLNRTHPTDDVAVGLLEEINPYASPTVVDMKPPEPEPIGAWRDGDDLILLSKGAAPPKACMKSNRSLRVTEFEMYILPSPWILLLFLVPFVGVFAALIGQEVMVNLGRAGKVKLWLPYWSTEVRKLFSALIVFLVCASSANKAW